MNKAKKKETLALMKPLFEGAHVYLLNSQGLSANQSHTFRRMLHEKGIFCRMVPNTLLNILFNESDKAPLSEVLSKTSLVLITKENPSIPAKIIEDFQKESKTKKLAFKGAFAYGDVFIGQNHLEKLKKLKSKEELIGGLMQLLNAPMQNLLGALKSGEQKIRGVLKALEKK